MILCETNPAARSEILSKVSGIEGLIWKSSLKLDNEILEAAGPQLKSISCMSEKYEKIDIIEITRRGIPIGYTPTVASDAIADMAIGLMIAAARRFHEGRLKIEQLRNCISMDKFIYSTYYFALDLNGNPGRCGCWDKI